MTRIEKIRQVVSQHQCAKIEGVLMDATTAKLVSDIYSRLNPTNQDKLSQMSMPEMIDICWRVYNKAKA